MMKAKTFLFIGSWMEPLKALPVEQRWNVMEAIVEYATSGELCRELELTESIAFAFLRNEIDRMRNYRTDVCESRRNAANISRRKECTAPKYAEEAYPEHTMNANACKSMQADAPYDIESVSESKSKTVSDKKSSSTTACARESECLFFDLFAITDVETPLRLGHEFEAIDGVDLVIALHRISRFYRPYG